MTEQIYQNLVGSIDASAPESIHLCDFPTVKKEFIDAELEANMDHVLKLVVMGRACRNTSNIKNRQPIGQMFVKAGFELPEFYQEIVADELNVKNVKFTEDVRDFTSYSFKPQLKTVGPKYGKMLGGIRQGLEQLDGNEMCIRDRFPTMSISPFKSTFPAIPKVASGSTWKMCIRDRQL